MKTSTSTWREIAPLTTIWTARPAAEARRQTFRLSDCNAAKPDTFPSTLLLLSLSLSLSLFLSLSLSAAAIPSIERGRHNHLCVTTRDNCRCCSASRNERWFPPPPSPPPMNESSSVGFDKPLTPSTDFQLATEGGGRKKEEGRKVGQFIPSRGGGGGGALAAQKRRLALQCRRRRRTTGFSFQRFDKSRPVV